MPSHHSASPCFSITLPYIMFVTPLCLHNTSLHSTKLYHAITSLRMAIQFIAVPLLCAFCLSQLIPYYAILYHYYDNNFITKPLLSNTRQRITFANHYFWKRNPTLPLQIATVTLYQHISIAIRFHSILHFSLALLRRSINKHHSAIPPQCYT